MPTALYELKTKAWNKYILCFRHAKFYSKISETRLKISMEIQWLRNLQFWCVLASTRLLNDRYFGQTELVLVHSTWLILSRCGRFPDKSALANPTFRPRYKKHPIHSSKQRARGHNGIPPKPSMQVSKLVIMQIFLRTQAPKYLYHNVLEYCTSCTSLQIWHHFNA